MSYCRPGKEYVRGDQIDPCFLRKAHVEEFAEVIAKECEFQVGTDPKELVEDLNGRIHLLDIAELSNSNTSGSIFVHGTEDFDICLPTYTSPLRDRFTIAHELGHYFLHSAQGDIPIVAFRNGSTRIEWEANWFAASLLMPKAEFRQAARLGLSVAALASRFGVSQEAARVRKEALGE